MAILILIIVVLLAAGVVAHDNRLKWVDLNKAWKMDRTQRGKKYNSKYYETRNYNTGYFQTRDEMMKTFHKHVNRY